MKKKLVVIIICVLLVIFLMAGVAGGYFLVFHRSFDFTAEELPFGLEWGMTRQEAENRMFDEFELVCDAETEYYMLYIDIPYNGMNSQLFLYFDEDFLRGISLKIFAEEIKAGLIYNELKELYQKDALLEGIYSDRYLSREYITEKHCVYICKLDTQVSLSIDDIERYTIDGENSRRDMVAEAEKMGVKSVTVPEDELLLFYLLPDIE